MGKNQVCCRRDDTDLMRPEIFSEDLNYALKKMVDGGREGVLGRRGLTGRKCKALLGYREYSDYSGLAERTSAYGGIG